MSTIVIKEVSTEFVKKGKAGYNMASVVYDDNGKRFTKKIMSFANPSVYEVVTSAKPEDVFEVKIVKEGEYYNWAALTPAAKEDSPKSPAAGRVVGNNYETADERKIKQLYIIKQSSIANALEYLKNTQPSGDYGVVDVANIAQEFVDFVYGVDENLDSVDEAA